MATRDLSLHKSPQGYWRTQWRGDDGQRFTRNFGPVYAVALREFQEFRAAWLGSGDIRNGVEHETLSVAAAVERYNAYARKYYVRADGTQTGEAANLEAALRQVTQLFGALPAAEFALKHLARVQVELARSGLSRSVINDSVRRIRTAWRWMCNAEIVPAERFAQLRALDAVRINRPLVDADGQAVAVQPAARRGSVADEWIERAIAAAPETLAVMMRVQWLTAMRPGEVVIMRPCDLDMSGADGVWFYAPQQHKTAHFGKARQVAIGPVAQGLLKPLLPAVVERYVFSPRESERKRYAACKTHRRVPVKPAVSTRRVGDRYTTKSYAKAIARVCEGAGLPVFGPNALRHSALTRVRREMGGLDFAQVVAGHATADVTQVYAEADRRKMVRVAMALG